MMRGSAAIVMRLVVWMAFLLDERPARLIS
jgi:hypothetical protein